MTQPKTISALSWQPEINPKWLGKMNESQVKGDYAYILWTAETADNRYELATDTFVVRDGKIVAQSFAAKILPKG